MNPYTVEKIQDGSVIYFFIRCMEDMSIMPLPTKYLTHMTKARKSPNTVLYELSGRQGRDAWGGIGTCLQ